MRLSVLDIISLARASTRLDLAPWGVALILAGCSGYVEQVASDAGQAVVPDEGSPESTVVDEPAPEPEPEPEPKAEPKPQLENDASVTELTPPIEIALTGDLRIARSSTFDGYLTDSNGRALYMFVDDKPGVDETACLDVCAADWTPFDVVNIQLGAGIEPSEVSRFHRQDGLWQTRYKDHPLYYRASEENSHDVTADQVDGRWFVARDYFAFMSSPKNFAPVEDPQGRARVLTDGVGHTLYICLDDQPETATSPAVSSCADDCLATRPPWVVRATNFTTVLPSVLNPTDLRAYVRPDGLEQLTYRGWPLYYFRGDAALGEIEGHNQKAWRAIEPVVFGLGPTAAVTN